MIDTSKVDNIVFGGVHHWDYPDYSDAYIESAEYEGRELTDEEIDWLRDNEPDWFYNKLMDSIF